ncbi:hypothetical protein BO94DRAFT_545064 [Aspergillus sclerotioniger CBS 115572]|uniref:Uncharacterized protein n=1 Tax=Aspergillus sclerotioniger CBS 115572 TaxID=1450535 RepID=A0A317WW74_9EURO|nr:hypothetical protein BO94DRAFT_545064 [Aspergillus sclerotioniger CBS 115572]PWY90305.1 hypothetical protein BO94DRAFT_545064 [Aspergillus sclerotioniger CBS 115572]
MAAHASNQFYHLNNGPRPHPHPHRAPFKNGYKNNKNNRTTTSSSIKGDQSVDVFLRPQNKKRQNQHPPTYRVPNGQRKPPYNKPPQPHDGDIIMRDSNPPQPQPQYPKRSNNPPYNTRPYNNNRPYNSHVGQRKPFYYRTDRDGDVLMKDVFIKPSSKQPIKPRAPQTNNRTNQRGQQMPSNYNQDIEMIDTPIDQDGDTIMVDV